MAIGIGGKSMEQALAGLSDMTAGVRPIQTVEYRQRMDKACGLMQQQNIDAMLINAGTNLHYFCGVDWYVSERLVAALLFASGELYYLLPHFELGTLKPLFQVPGEILTWQEHDNPYALCMDKLCQHSGKGATLILDDSAPYFIADGLGACSSEVTLRSARSVIGPCRSHKSASEITLIQRAMDMTMAVHQAAASVLFEGISCKEVENFIHQAHKQVGASGSYFCIVLFGADTAFPHGVKQPSPLKLNDMVLIDTGCRLHGYLSDITRSYVFGQASDRQRQVWQWEKQAQQLAFEAARPGAPCQNADRAVRAFLTSQGLGPDYQLPGVPHRTGHGIGLDIHEGPYLVEGETQPLAPGMCFSNEPMLVMPGEFGVRLEDHFYITEQGPRWFTSPAYSLDDPFGLAAP
ncbi:M24 family metallopeptidase [Bowmanella dokdonensis]|uniref:Aminopeptidase P family protein n=1 Tax=Bowmanella dokdonensis TaxID=751969 RepID=A0A939DMJ4_9ALTE|nr:Xaa-Pro peptidase family protein [Bowmanella dokdonensis]MBN7825233.1 aminopeptidase P family protein [Bowmanella dokdonensis]